MAATLDLRTDEAYYWTWSRDLALSYLDHPPMVAWFVKLGTLLFGDTALGARFTHLVAMALIELVFADIARRRTGSAAAALLVVLALESTLNYGVTSAFIEPGIPLVLFLSLQMWCLCRLDETGDGRWWLLVGVLGGLALLSKLTAVFALPAVLAYLLATPRTRRWLGSVWPWVGVAIALAIFTPVLLWNGANDWASFRFQAGRATELAGADLGRLATYLVTNLAFSGPLLAPVAIFGAGVGLMRFARAGEPVGLALATGFVVPFLYLFERSLYLYVNPSWLIQIWPFGFAALAIAACRPGAGPALRRAALTGIAIGLVVPAALLAHATLERSVWLGPRDPFGADAGYDVAAQQVRAMAGESGAGWIGTSDYRTYAALRWQLRDIMLVVQLTERSRFIGFAAPAGAILSGPGLYVFRDAPQPLVLEGAGSAAPLGEVGRIWRGEPIGSLGVWKLDGWTLPLSPPRDSPYFSWPDLV